MPISWAMSDSGDFLVLWNTGTVTPEDLLRTHRETAERMPAEGEFATLLIYEPGVDLSSLDIDALSALYRARSESLVQRRARRRAGAAVVPSSAEAEIILPLWNALNEAGGSDISFRAFRRLPDALAHLGVDPDAARRVMARRPD